MNISRRTSPAARRRLAQQWELVLVRAYRPGSVSAWQAPVARRTVLAAADDLRRLVGLLSGSEPVPAAGILMARRLLTDGTGPLYAVGNSRDLATAVRETVRQLDPSTRMESPGTGGGWSRT
jgi:hypothetical protein